MLLKSGLESETTAKLFRNQFPSSVIVFCPGVCLPTVESFETTPFRYLLKKYRGKRMIYELKVVVKGVKNKLIEPVVPGTWKYNAI